MKNAFFVISICFLLFLSGACSNNIMNADSHENMRFLGYFDSAPADASELDFYYNISDSTAYVFIDGSWHIAAWKSSGLSASFENIEFNIDGDGFYADGQNLFIYDLPPVYYSGVESDYVFNINLKNTGTYPVDISSFQLKNHSSEVSLDRTGLPKVLKPEETATLRCIYSPSLSSAYQNGNSSPNSLLYFQIDLQDEYKEYWVNSYYFAPYFSFETNGLIGGSATIGHYQGNYSKVDFGDVRIGEARSIEFEAQCTEYGEIQIKDISLAGEDSADFLIDFPENGNLMKVSLVLNANETGKKKANLILKTDLRGNEEVSIPIMMTAIK